MMREKYMKFNATSRRKVVVSRLDNRHTLLGVVVSPVDVVVVVVVVVVVYSGRGCSYKSMLSLVNTCPRDIQGQQHPIRK